MPAPLRARLVECIEKVRKEYPQAKEVKGAKLLQTDKGRRILADFIDGAINLGCLPTYVVGEKRYCAAAKIVETFCDPAYNSEAEWLPTGANLDRQEVAEVIRSLPDKYLLEFMDAYRQPTLEGMLKSVESLGIALDLMGHQRLASTVRGNLAKLDELVEIESAESENLRHNIAISLNYPVFVQFLGRANEFLKRNRYEGHVVHDESKEFELAFKEVFRTLVGVGSHPIRSSFVLQDGQPIAFGLDAFKTFRMGQSSTELELQGADYLASAVKGIALMALGSGVEADCPHMKRLAKKVLPFIVFMNSGMILGSKEFIGLLMRPFAELLRELRAKN